MEGIQVCKNEDTFHYQNGDNDYIFDFLEQNFGVMKALLKLVYYWDCFSCVNVAYVSLYYLFFMNIKAKSKLV